MHRNAARLHSVGWGVAEWQVRANHEAMDTWEGHPEAFVIDNSRMDWTQTLAIVDEWEKRM